MARIASCVALFLTLACPALCHFVEPAANEPALTLPGEPAAPCSTCPHDLPQSPADPCEDNSCLCSPFLRIELRPDQRDDTLAAHLAVFAPSSLASELVPACAERASPASVSSWPPFQPASAGILPLLI